MWTAGHIIFRTFKFWTKMECNVSKSTDAELTPCTVKNTITYERPIVDILCLQPGLWQQLKAFEISRN